MGLRDGFTEKDRKQLDSIHHTIPAWKKLDQKVGLKSMQAKATDPGLAKDALDLLSTVRRDQNAYDAAVEIWREAALEFEALLEQAGVDGDIPNPLPELADRFNKGSTFAKGLVLGALNLFPNEWRRLPEFLREARALIGAADDQRRARFLVVMRSLAEAIDTGVQILPLGLEVGGYGGASAGVEGGLNASLKLVRITALLLVIKCVVEVAYEVVDQNRPFHSAA